MLRCVQTYANSRQDGYWILLQASGMGTERGPEGAERRIALQKTYANSRHHGYRTLFETGSMGTERRPVGTERHVTARKAKQRAGKMGTYKSCSFEGIYA